LFKNVRSASFLKAEICEKLLPKNLAIVHLLHGFLICRKGLQIADTDVGVRTRLLFALSTVVSSKEEKSKLIDQTIALNGNLIAAAMAIVDKRLSQQ
jgi:hypothetical protein